VAQLKERGYVERGWIGVQVQPLTKEIAESIGMKEAAGALITSIQPDSPAVASGLKPADVVTSINGAKIKDSRDLARQIAALAPNSTVTIEYLRDGKAHTASVRLGQLKEQTARKPPSPAIPGADGQTSKLGMAVAPASRVMGIGEQGLAVLRVDPNGKAAEIGLRPGDIILQVSGKDVSSPQDLAAALQEAATQKKQHLLALIRRSDREVFIAFPVTQS
jgi:serine protease Do